MKQCQGTPRWTAVYRAAEHVVSEAIVARLMKSQQDRMKFGSAIRPTSAWVKNGCTSKRLWICAREKWSCWSFSSTIKTQETTMPALKMANTRRRPAQGLIFHSDRGIQYADRNFRKLCAQHQILRSMSRKGDCWDNAVAESFFKTLKPRSFLGLQC
jgi:transposase InsO family protein